MTGDIAQVTVSGVLFERPDRSETETGVPTAAFWLQVTRRWTGRAGQPCDSTEFIDCFAVGHPANSIGRYGRAGIEVIVIGTLRTRTVPDEFTRAVRQMAPSSTFAKAELYIHVDSVGFISPRQVLEAHGRSW
jgi:single-stranded DNA-binding protein